jgi:hypothetical protein
MVEVNKKNDKLLNLCFVLFIGAFFVTRLFVYFQYNIKFIDTDQPYMWLGASDFSQGIFKEPRYYGQSYNTFMEALFSVPLLWLKLPVYYAVPIATHFISVFPFCFTAFFLFFQGKKLHALFVLSVLLCMPIHYDLLNSLPRGFVTGLFFCSFFVVSLLHPHRFGILTFNVLMAVTGYFVNPNSVLVSVPFIVYLFFKNYKNPRVYFIGAACLLFVWLNYLFFDKVYADHPEYIQNPLVPRFSPDFFLNNISNLDQRFGHINLFEKGKSWALILLMVFVAFFLFRQNRPAFFAFLFMPCIVLFSFCLGKITEGTDWVFISYSRMFLGIPLMLCLFVALLNVRIPFGRLALVVPLVFTVYKLMTHRDALAKDFDQTNFLGVRVYPLATVLDGMRIYKGACEGHGVDFMLVSNKFWLNNVLTYGGPAVDQSFPHTLETRLEKRHWVKEQFQDSVMDRFIFVSTRWDLEDRIPKTGWFRLENLDGYGLYLIEKNNLPLKKFIDVADAYEKMD